MTFSPCPKPISMPKPPKGLRQKNAQRAAGEFRRTLHSRARQKFVSMQPCSACGVWGYSQNAHVEGIEGAGMKGHYTTVTSLCGPRPDGTGIYIGCHRLHDTKFEEFRKRFPSFNGKRAAKATHARWLRWMRGQGTESKQ